MQVFGWHVPQAAVPAARFARRNPLITAVGGVAVVLFVEQQRQQRHTRLALLDSQQRVQQHLQETSRSLNDSLRALQRSVAQDARLKDEMFKALTVQNIEQVRSLNRLEKALETCTDQLQMVAPTPMLPALAPSTPSTDATPPPVVAHEATTATGGSSTTAAATTTGGSLGVSQVATSAGREVP